MNWPLSKPNVALRVTKFAPKVAAGLSDEQRAALQAKRKTECRKVKPDPSRRPL
jgi:hypothetical protein